MVNIGVGLGALLAGAIGLIWAKGASAKREPEMSATMPTATLSRPLLLVALLVGALLAATLGLWAYYGTAVFFEMLRNGWLACF
jgi:hypothetical protein